MILFNDFKAHYAAVRELVEPAVQRVLESGWYILGKELENFEARFAEWLGCPYAVGVASGTEAIALALMAAGIGRGDEVITTCLTAYPTIVGIEQSGATPVLADIDPDSGLIDPAEIAKQIGPRTRAIVPVHLYGQACDMDAIMALADAHGLEVIEDCAQSTGATWNDQQSGSFGRFGCFSFYPSKNLGAFGDGGAVVAKSAADAQRLCELRNYGQTTRYYHDQLGINSRLDEMQAAILDAKLGLLQAANARRIELAAAYRERLIGLEYLPEQAGSVYHLFVVKVPERDAFIDAMAVEGVQTLIHYPVPIHQQSAFRGRAEGEFANSAAFSKAIVSLPLYPEMSMKQIEQVADAVQRVRSQ
jgi:dTDP-4-amino-4,6-dideoxygalactose transaminase